MKMTRSRMRMKMKTRTLVKITCLIFTRQGESNSSSRRGICGV